MSLKPYPEYKDSGFEWLGSIPKMWRLNKFRHVFAESSEVNGPSPVGEMLSISGYRGVELKNYDDENQKRSNDQLETYRVVRAGQLAVNTMWLNYAGLGVSSIEGHVSPAYRAYWIHPSMNRRYVHYLMRSAVFVDGYTANLTGIRPNSLQMSRPALMSFPVIVPPIAEQQTIADYLDRETADIDAFIADQEELITLLAERRTATITQAVTNGLNPNAPMKDSGVEWLGDVPEGWTVQRLSNVTSAVIDCLHSTPEESDTGEFISVRTGCIRNGQLFPAKGLTIDEVTFQERTAKGTPELGDVFFTREAPAGEAALVDEIGRYALGQRMVLLKSAPGHLDSQFLVWNIYMPHVRNYIDVEANGSTVKNLPIPKIKSIPIIVPDQEQQPLILDYLNREVTKIDAAIADAREAIALSQERRSAVISAAVTGKIDVRGLVAPEAKEVEDVSVGAA